MGVPGLTTFVNGAQSSLAQSERRLVQEVQEKGSNGTAFVVDGWAWLFTIWHIAPTLRTLRANSPLHFDEIITEMVLAWQSAGLVVTVVFDGAYPPSKFGTVQERMRKIATSNDFLMRLSAASRDSSPIDMRNPLASATAVDALRKLPGVEVIFALEEADPLVVSLARQKGGYAVSLDSDYYILGLQSEEHSFLGYVPLDSIVYAIEQPRTDGAHNAPLATSGTADDPSDGFEPVRKGKNRSKNKTAVIAQPSQVFGSSSVPLALNSRLPPRGATSSPLLSDGNLVEVSFQSYHPARLARYLQIPAALLPLVAAILSNDHTDHDPAVFRSSNDPIRFVANGVREQWQKIMSPQKQKSVSSGSSATATPTSTSARTPLSTSAVRTAISTPKRATSTTGLETPPADPLHTLVVATLNTLQTQQTITAEDAVTESIIKGIESYHIFGTSDNVSGVSEETGSFARRSGSARRESALEVYRARFRDGYFDSNFLAILTTRTYFANLMPEDPDTISVNAGPAAEVLGWVLAVVFDAWEMDWAREEMEEPGEEEEVGDEESGLSTTDSEEEVIGRAKRRWIGGGGYRDGQQPEDIISVHDESSAEESSTVSDMEVGSMDRRRLSLDGVSDFDDDDEEGDEPTAEAIPIKPPPAVTVWLRRGGRLVGHQRRIQSLASVLRGDREAEFQAPLPRSLAALLDDHESAEASRSHESSRSVDLSESIATVKPVNLPAPMVLQPLQTRLDFYLHALRANTLPIIALEQPLWPLASTLRLLVTEGAERHGISRAKNNWTLAEMGAVARAGCAAYVASRKRRQATRTGALPDPFATLPPSAPPTTRAIHLVSSVQIVLQTAELLAQSLDLRPSPFDAPHTLFDGRLYFHLLATSSSPQKQESGAEAGDSSTTDSLAASGWHDAEADSLAKTLLDAALSGLDSSVLGIDVDEARRARKAAKKRTATLERETGGKGKGGGGTGVAPSGTPRSGNLFELLGDE